jgi:RHS repeat-associated protein
VTELSNITYTYDSVSNIESITDIGQELSREMTYTYDNLNRLTHTDVTIDGATENRDYTYSPTGNVMTKGDVGTYTYTDDRHPQAVTSAGSYTFNYDENGNLENESRPSGDSLTYTYDYLDRLTDLETRSSESSVTGLTQYRYLDSTDRIQKLLLSDNEIRTYLGTQAEVDQDANFTDYIFSADQRVAALESGQTYFNSQDHLSSVNLITGSGGELIQTLDYYPYGGERVNEKTSSFDTHYTYTDQEKDAESGLMYYDARYYHPGVGRFISPDPVALYSPQSFLADPQQLNLYAYTRNNPVKYTDPSGKSTDFPDFIEAYEAIKLLKMIDKTAGYLLNPQAPKDQGLALVEDWVRELRDEVIVFASAAFTTGGGPLAGGILWSFKNAKLPTHEEKMRNIKTMVEKGPPGYVRGYFNPFGVEPNFDINYSPSYNPLLDSREYREEFWNDQVAHRLLYPSFEERAFKQNLLQLQQHLNDFKDQLMSLGTSEPKEENTP